MFFKKIMRIKKLTLADIEFNEWNGFVLTILGIEYQGKKTWFSRRIIRITFFKSPFNI